MLILHDAVRPFVQDVLLSVVEAADTWGAALPMLPVKDTIKTVRDGWVVKRQSEPTAGSSDASRVSPLAGVGI